MTGELPGLFRRQPYRGGPVGPWVRPVLLTASSSTTDGTSFATSSVTPAANTPHFLAVACSHGTTAETPNSVTGNGLTWTLVPSSAVSTTGLGRRVAWFYAFGTAPSAGAITIGFATSHSGAAWALVSGMGGTLAAPRQATTNTANSTTVTGTLAALGTAANMHLYAIIRSLQEDTVPPATGGWAELADHPTTSFATPACALQVAWSIGDTTADPTWTTSGQVAISSLEVRA